MLHSLLFALVVGITPSSDSHRLIDSGLSVIGMKRADCAMPPDMVTPDVHRLPFHDSLFTQPLGAFDLAGRFSDTTWTPAHASSVLANAMSVLELGTYREVTYATRRSPDQLIKSIGTDITTHTDMAGSIIILRMVEAVVDALDATGDARKRWNASALLREQCDSIWMNAEDDPDGSLFDGVFEARKARKRIEQFFRMANPEGISEIYVQGASLYQHCLRVADDASNSRRTLSDSVKTVIMNTSIGRIAIGGAGDDVYAGDFALIIDVGGNDVYTNTTSNKNTSLKLPVSVIIDLDGNDSYLGSGYAYGAGICGIGIIVDQQGNDVYNTGDFSLGCGLFGVGIVHDRAGNDAYMSGQNTQGAGIFGIGMLIDDQGHDTYRAHAQAQGFGATRGFGLMFDTQGNDQYLAASPYVDVLRYEAHYVTFTQGAALGHRPIASGGIGLLVDMSGNDLYSTDIYGQGTGYWFGLGAVIDRKGEDRYQAYQYAQGSGVHFATGLLLDGGGDDVYASHGVSQGCGHDVALGAMIDEGGNDVYSVESLSLGGGNANAVSIFIDRTGDDSYVARNETNTMGYSDFRRWMGMIGLFVDGGGADLYGVRRRNDTTTIKSTYGTFVDREWIKDSVSAQPPIQYAALPLANDVDSLFIQASAAPLKYQNNVEPARAKLASMGKSILPDLAIYFDTDMPRERLALEFILPKMRESDTATIDSLLVDVLKSDDMAERALAATVAGKVRTSVVIPALLGMAVDSSWRVRRLAALTLGQIGDTTSRPMLIRLLSDQHPYVRARAGYALGLIGDSVALDTAGIVLADQESIVRSTTAEGFSRGRTRSFSQIARIWQRAPQYDLMITNALLLRACDTSTASQAQFAAHYAAAAPPERLALDRMLPSLPSVWTRALQPSSPAPAARSKKKRSK